MISQTIQITMIIQTIQMIMTTMTAVRQKNRNRLMNMTAVLTAPVRLYAMSQCRLKNHKPQRLKKLLLRRSTRATTILRKQM